MFLVLSFYPSFSPSPTAGNLPRRFLLLLHSTFKRQHNMAKSSIWNPRLGWCLLLAVLLVATFSNAQPVKGNQNEIAIRGPTEISDVQLEKRAALAWFIAGAAIAAKLNAGSCNKPDPGWIDNLACFASSCILGYSALAAILRGLNSQKRGLGLNFEPFEIDHHHFGKQTVGLHNEIFNGDRHELMNFIMGNEHHTLHFSFDQTSQRHTLSAAVKNVLSSRQTYEEEGDSDGGVNVDYHWIDRDVAEENAIGNVDGVEGQLEGSLLNSGVNSEDYFNQEFFCANLQDMDFPDQGLTGAYFVSNGAYPYREF